MLLLAASAHAQVAADYAVQVSATVQTAPARIALTWPSSPAASSYTVYRKTYSATTWGAAIATLPSTATGYVDNAVTVGARYEYQVLHGVGTGYLASGIEATLVEGRGKVVLIVDNTNAAALTSELTRLIQDLVGDGWTVLRHDVARAASVPSVKALIQADYNADPTNVRAVFLFGHVPVPYSGDIAPDGHSNHVGAWPADMYYGDMTTAWTDIQDFPGSQPGRQSNHPGDGKFDQSSAPSDIDLEVGRVDLQDMPAFAPKTELDLLRQYLNKDHNFRHKLITAQPRGLIDDNFGAFSGEAFASSGWRAFSAFFGAANVFALDWFTTLNTNSYLWAYGCGGGSFTSAGGVGSTSNFAATDTKTVFTMLFGSYHGDWDVQNNFLRAPLATTTYGLTCAWAGRPPWYFHHMGMGEEIGYSTRLTQNNVGLYWYSWSRSIHIALMGDPTLRMHAVAPASGLTTAALPGGVSLTWSASPDTVLGYNVYRSPDASGPYTRVSGAPVAGTSYQDAGVSPGTYTYMVRAVKLETSASGSYFNPSQGVFASGTALPPGGAARVFVSPTGSDGNDCSVVSTPCRNVAAAVTQVAPGGDVIVTDTGSYGGATIGKAVTIEAAPGVAAFFGQTIAVAAGSGDAVVLRGLTSKAAVPGSGTGILYTSGGSLFVESCTVNGWATGVAVNGAGSVFLKDTAVRNATVMAVSIAHAGARAILDRTRLESSTAGLSVTAGATAAVRSGVASGMSGVGLAANGGTLEIDRFLVANNGTGVAAGPAAGTVRISSSIVSDNGTGLAQSGAASLLSRGDNTVEGNGTNTAGTLGAFGLR